MKYVVIGSTDGATWLYFGAFDNRERALEHLHRQAAIAGETWQFRLRCADGDLVDALLKCDTHEDRI